MRVAAVYDIHGNLPALEAVLDEVRAARTWNFGTRITILCTPRRAFEKTKYPQAAEFAARNVL